MPIGLNNTHTKKKSSWIKKIFLGIFIIIVIYILLFMIGARSLLSTHQLQNSYRNVVKIVFVENNATLKEKEKVIQELQDFNQLTANPNLLSLRIELIIMANKKLELDKEIAEIKDNKSRKFSEQKKLTRQWDMKSKLLLEKLIVWTEKYNKLKKNKFK